MHKYDIFMKVENRIVITNQQERSYLRAAIRKDLPRKWYLLQGRAFQTVFYDCTFLFFPKTHICISFYNLPFRCNRVKLILQVN